MNLRILLTALLLTGMATDALAQARNTRATGAGAVGNTYGNTGTRTYRHTTVLGDAMIQVDAETRSLIVVTDEETYASIAKVVAKLDNPKPQVLIKVVFVEITLDKDFDVGVEGSYTIKTGKNQTLDLSTLFNNAILSGAPGAYATLSASDFSATLHALSSSGKAKVLSRPSIMARNNQEAVIIVGQQVPIVTNSQVTDQGNIINTIRYQDVGIILRVTPFISSDKTVEMIVAPEISALSDKTIPVGTNVNVPIINKRSAETVVVTPHATTVVIGGLMQKKESKIRQKVPILGDIPLLGLPFRRTVNTESRSELLIFLTPYIVDSNESLTQLTVDEANRAELARRYLTADEVSDNLDTLRLQPQPDADPAVVVQTQTIVKAVPVSQPTPKPKPKATPSPTPKKKG